MTNDELRNAIKGQVLLPGDAGFDTASTPWNLAIDQPVAAVVEAEDADDVAALVRHARKTGLTVSTQPSGHGATGDVDGVILLRTRRLGGVEVRAEERTARLGAGAQWGEVQAAAGAHGLTGLPGSAPGVSVVGYSLGGGLGWFGRKHGYASDAVRSLDIVSADGDRSTITATSDPDLFWALRGGGGDFAVVTAIEIDLHPAPALYGGAQMWPAERAAEVFQAFRAITAVAPPELSLWVSRLQVPGGPHLVTLHTAFLGEADEARELLHPLEGVGGELRDTRGPLASADVGAITADPTEPSPGKSRAELLTGIDDGKVEDLLARPVDPLLTVQLRHLGGALTASGEGAGASGAVAEPYLLYLLGLALTPEQGEAAGAKQGEIVQDLAASVSGRKPFTFLAPGEPASAAFDAGTITRLRAIKQARDPRGTLRSNFPVLA